MRLSTSSLSTVQVYQSLISGGRRDQHPNLGRLSLSTMTEAMKVVSELGFTSYELYVDSQSNLSLLLDEKNITAVQSVCADLGLKVERAYFEFLPHHLLDGTSPNAIAVTWSAIGRLCGRLGTQVVEMVSPPLPRTPENGGSQPFERLWDDFVSSMREYTVHASSHGLKLAIEPRPREILSGTDSLLRLLDHIPSDNLGGVVDISHLQIVREVPDVSIRKLHRKVFSVHLSDNDGVTEWHWAPGQGQIDWPPVMDSLASIGYDGTLSLDVSGIDVRSELMEGKQFVENMLGRPIGPSSVRRSMAG